MRFIVTRADNELEVVTGDFTTVDFGVLLIKRFSEAYQQNTIIKAYAPSQWLEVYEDGKE